MAAMYCCTSYEKNAENTRKGDRKSKARTCGLDRKGYKV